MLFSIFLFFGVVFLYLGIWVASLLRIDVLINKKYQFISFELIFGSVSLGLGITLILLAIKNW